VAHLYVQLFEVQSVDIGGILDSRGSKQYMKGDIFIGIF
jgi:hypothetical protein